MSERIELKIGSKLYRGWKTVRIQRSLEQLCGAFSLSVSERWSGQDKPWPINEDDPCAVTIEDSPIITGYVHRVKTSLNLDDHSISVEGRDKACDVVDCSAQLGKWQFSQVNALELAKKICAPYGVNVAMQSNLIAQTITVPKKYSIDPGDTAATALENLLKVAGLLAISDGLGGIVLTRASSERVATTLVEGLNLLPGSSATFDSSGRFRNYEVTGSHKGRDDLSGESAAGVKGTATDLNARAGRTLVIRPDTSVTPDLANKRAQWEATVRAGRAASVTANVAGWTESPFGVWPLNKLVRVKSPGLRVDGDMLIVGVTFTRDISSGTLTQLDLRDPRAFTPDPTIAKHGGGNNYWREIERGV